VRLVLVYAINFWILIFGRLVYSGLEPWREYSIRIQAFTNQIEDGRGPLGVMKAIRTKPDSKLPNQMMRLTFLDKER
jgi:hypothetical protein